MPHMSGLVASPFSSEVPRTEASRDSPTDSSTSAARCQRRTKVATPSRPIGARTSSLKPSAASHSSGTAEGREVTSHRFPGKARTSSRSQRRAAVRQSWAISSMPSTSSTPRRARRTRSTQPGGCSPATGQPTARRKSPGKGSSAPGRTIRRIGSTNGTRPIRWGIPWS
ncbi:hypothetical protein STENM327S_08114 [Streptomyces tendae]